jgi:hypothetical protein
MSEQHQHLARVADNIGATVVRFCAARIGATFSASALRYFVTHVHPHIAPESPGRILRELKKRGIVDYVLVSRAQSLYRVVSVREGE